MVRLLQRWEVTYGHFADFVNAVEAVNVINRERGWAEFTLWAPASGKANEVVLISDYADFATFKNEESSTYADAEFMKAWRQGAQYVVQGSGTFEVLEPAPHLA